MGKETRNATGEMEILGKRQKRQSRKCNEVKLAGAPVGYAGVPAK